MELIINSDCLKELKKIDSDSIDAVITDPPYGYSFMGKSWDKVLPSISIWKECLRVMKHGAFACIMSAPRQDVMSRMMINLEDAGFDIGFSSIYWAYASGFPKAGNVSKMIDKKLGVEPKIVGKKPYTNQKLRQGPKPTDGYIGLENVRIQADITEPVSEQAKKMDGSYIGCQPKPALEVIIVCMKPLDEDRYVDQALKNGKGVTWFDDCKIPYISDDDFEKTKTGHKQGWQNASDGWSRPAHKNYTKAEQSPKGRFPANLLVSDNAIDTGKITKSEGGKTKRDTAHFGGSSFTMQGYGDSGDFSRYFSLDQWQSQFLVTEKPTRPEKEKGLHPDKSSLAEFCSVESASGIFPNTTNLNSHPTVKPITLMAYLITMVSRKDDVILDPFLGSGTTAIAASLLQRDSLGIDSDHHSCVIAQQRLNYWKNKSFDKISKIIKEHEKTQIVKLDNYQ